LIHKGAGLKFQVSGSRLRRLSIEPGTLNLKPGTLNLKPGTLNLEL
jgi:hypothetical protein